VIGGLHGPTHHYFCPHCMSWMYTRAAVLDWFVNRRPTMLDGGMEHTLHRDLHQGKAPLGQPAIHRFPEFPAFGEYEGLVMAYQAHALA
jgi:hypothetical protein